jgi:hypothetical protein
MVTDRLGDVYTKFSALPLVGAVNENLLYRLPQVLLLGIQCLYILAIPSFLGPKPEAAGFPFSKRIRNSSSTMDYLIIFLTENGALPTAPYRNDDCE